MATHAEDPTGQILPALAFSKEMLSRPSVVRFVQSWGQKFEFLLPSVPPAERFQKETGGDLSNVVRRCQRDASIRKCVRNSSRQRRMNTLRDSTNVQRMRQNRQGRLATLVSLRPAIPQRNREPLPN